MLSTPTGTTARPPALPTTAGTLAYAHVTWQRHGGRAEEFAHALGGRAVHVYPAALAERRWVLLRYLVSAVLTAVALVRLRPRAVAVVNPPVVPGLVVAAWSRLTGTPYLLDSHTSSFGVKGNAVARRTLGVTRLLARRSAGVMVTTTSWVAEVQRWGAAGPRGPRGPARAGRRARARPAAARRSSSWGCSPPTSPSTRSSTPRPCSPRPTSW